MAQQEKDQILVTILERHGLRGVAEACGITIQAVSQWRRVPPYQVLTVEQLTGIPRDKLRPDLHGAPRPRPRRRQVAEAAA